MDWDNLAPMIVLVVATLTVGGVLLLRPISKRIAELLEVYARDKDTGQQSEIRRLREVVETLDARMRLLEERQDFTDKLLEGPSSTRDPARLPRQAEGPDAST